MSKELNKSICEEQIFERIYNKYAKDLHDFLYYKYGEQFNPKDKAQDAFIKLWDNCKEVALSKAKSFLFSIISFSTFFSGLQFVNKSTITRLM